MISRSTFQSNVNLCFANKMRFALYREERKGQGEGRNVSVILQAISGQPDVNAEYPLHDHPFSS